MRFHPVALARGEVMNVKPSGLGSEVELLNELAPLENPQHRTRRAQAYSGRLPLGARKIPKGEERHRISRDRVHPKLAAFYAFIRHPLTTPLPRRRRFGEAAPAGAIRAHARHEEALDERLRWMLSTVDLHSLTRSAAAPLSGRKASPLGACARFCSSRSPLDLAPFRDLCRSRQPLLQCTEQLRLRLQLAVPWTQIPARDSPQIAHGQLL